MTVQQLHMTDESHFRGQAHKRHNFGRHSRRIATMQTLPRASDANPGALPRRPTRQVPQIGEITELRRVRQRVL